MCSICNINRIDVAVSFIKSTYNINEDDGAVQVELVLTKPSSADFTVQVMNVDGTATGK